MKKIVILIFVLVLTVAIFAGCGVADKANDYVPNGVNVGNDTNLYVNQDNATATPSPYYHNPACVNGYHVEGCEYGNHNPACYNGNHVEGCGYGYGYHNPACVNGNHVEGCIYANSNNNQVSGNGYHNHNANEVCTNACPAYYARGYGHHGGGCHNR